MLLDKLEAEVHFFPLLVFPYSCMHLRFFLVCSPFPYFIVFPLDLRQTLFVYHPMSKEASVTTNTPMKGFFDSDDAITKAMASATATTT